MGSHKSRISKRKHKRNPTKEGGEEIPTPTHFMPSIIFQRQKR
jgi:hypothetical protein